MNTKKTTECIKKFKPVENGNDIIFFDTLDFHNNSFMLIQDDSLKITLWNISDVSFVISACLKLSGIVNCYHLRVISDSDVKLIVGCKNRNIVQISVKLSVNNSADKYTMVIADVNKSSGGPIKWIITVDETEYWAVNQLGQYFKLHNGQQNRNQQKIKNQLKIRIKYLFYIQQIEQFVCLLENSNIPYLLSKENLLVLLQNQHPNSQIDSINAHYSSEIDDHLQLAEITAVAYTNWNQSGKIVIGQSNGLLHVFNIQNVVEQYNSECILPTWYTQQLVAQFSLEINKSILSLDVYAEYLVVSSDQKVVFLDLWDKKKVFNSLQQKSNCRINEVRWTKNQKIILGSILSRTPKVYLFSKQLPIKKKGTEQLINF